MARRGDESTHPNGVSRGRTARSNVGLARHAANGSLFQILEIADADGLRA
jgi:hypothetical protein